MQYITPNTLRPILIFLYLNVPGGILPLFLVIFIYVLKFCLQFLSHTDHMLCPFHLAYRPHALLIPSLIQTTCPAHSISYTDHMLCPFHLSYRPHAVPILSLIQTTHTISHAGFMPCPFHLPYKPHALPIRSTIQTTCPAHSISHTGHIPCPFRPIQTT